MTLSSDGAAASAPVSGSPYAITPSAAVFGVGSAANYLISYHDGSLTVDPAALTITASDQSKTYGEALTFAGTEFSTNGLVNGDAVASVSLTSLGTLASAPVSGSPYAITASDALGHGPRQLPHQLPRRQPGGERQGPRHHRLRPDQDLRRRSSSWAAPPSASAPASSSAPTRSRA